MVVNEELEKLKLELANLRKEAKALGSKVVEEVKAGDSKIKAAFEEVMVKIESVKAKIKAHK